MLLSFFLVLLVVAHLLETSFAFRLRQSVVDAVNGQWSMVEQEARTSIESSIIKRCLSLVANGSTCHSLTVSLTAVCQSDLVIDIPVFQTDARESQPAKQRAEKLSKNFCRRDDLKD